jgi:hypothetical protein
MIIDSINKICLGNIHSILSIIVLEISISKTRIFIIEKYKGLKSENQNNRVIDLRFYWKIQEKDIQGQ